MKTAGLTRLEKIAIGTIVGIVILILVPFYRQIVEIKRTADCLSNLKEISTALSLYQQDVGNAFPLAYYALPDGSPITDSAGRPITWVHAISGYVRKDLERVFKCPADPLGGSTVLTHPRNPNRTLRLSYGFYLPMSAQKLEWVPNLSDTILIADSVAGGQLGTIDPNPLLNGNDGFVLTFDDALIRPTPNSRFIARLAIWRRNAQGDWVAENLRSFHLRRDGVGINVLHADGHAVTRSPTILFLQRNRKGTLEPPWSLPNPPDSRENTPTAPNSDNW